MQERHKDPRGHQPLDLRDRRDVTERTYGRGGAAVSAPGSAQPNHSQHADELTVFQESRNLHTAHQATEADQTGGTCHAMLFLAGLGIVHFYFCLSKSWLTVPNNQLFFHSLCPALAYTLNIVINTKYTILDAVLSLKYQVYYHFAYSPSLWLNLSFYTTVLCLDL